MSVFQIYGFVFLLAMFLGVELIRKVPSQLHTPLMSGSNAISGISLIGAMALAGTAVRIASATDGGPNWFVMLLAGAAIGFAAVNVVGGYLVTDRMLKMFGGSKPAAGQKGGAA